MINESYCSIYASKIVESKSNCPVGLNASRMIWQTQLNTIYEVILSSNQSVTNPSATNYSLVIGGIKCFIFLI